MFWAAAVVFYEARPGFSWLLADPVRALLLCLFYPLIEEWLFRGVIQGALLQRAVGARGKLGVSVANLVTTGLFFALHWIGRSFQTACWVIGPSLILGIVRERTQSIVVPMLIHCVWNLRWYSLSLQVQQI